VCEYDRILGDSQKRFPNIVSPAVEWLAKLTPTTLQNCPQPVPALFWSYAVGPNLADSRVNRCDRLPFPLQRRSRFPRPSQRAAQDGQRCEIEAGELLRSRFGLGAAKLA
jgi:hypothetical protein